jgi:non-heme chloroperoxidase
MVNAMTMLDYVDTDFVPPYRMLAVEGGQIAWWEQGTGEDVVVWVHGLPLDSRSWEAQRRHFAPRCRNVFLDLRGYGRSTKLPAGTRDVTALYCADLEALLGHLGLERVLLVGFASAGHVALRFAANHPRRVGKLVAINGSPRFRRGEDWPWGFSDEGIDHFVRPLRERGIEGITDAVLEPQTVFRDLPVEDARRLGDWFRPMSLAAGGDTLLGFFDGISHDDDRHLLGRIEAQTLLIAGTIGKEVPTGVGLYLRQAIRNARLVELPGVDHFSFATRPDMVNALIDDFLFELHA